MMTILIWLIATILTVSIIGIVTSMINNKPRCDHYWEDLDDGNSRCKKCNRTIYLRSDNTDKTDFA